MSGLWTPPSTYVAATRVVEQSTVSGTQEMIEVLQFYLGLLLAPRKLWHLPQLVSQLQLLQWHEAGLAEDHAKGRAGNCKISQREHELMAEEYAEILGVFHEEDDRVVTRFE